MKNWALKEHTFIYAVLLSIVTLMLEYISGPHIHIPVFFAFPVLLLSWHRNWRQGASFAIALCGIHFSYRWYWEPFISETLIESALNAILRAGALCLLAYGLAKHREMDRELRMLKGILPICSFCKKIRDKQDHWHTLEVYIRDHSEAEFSHGLCPSCVQEHYGDLLANLKTEKLLE